MTHPNEASTTPPRRPLATVERVPSARRTLRRERRTRELMEDLTSVGGFLGLAGVVVLVGFAIVAWLADPDPRPELVAWEIALLVAWVTGLVLLVAGASVTAVAGYRRARSEGLGRGRSCWSAVRRFGRFLLSWMP